MRNYSNAAMALRRIVILAVIGGILGCIRAISSGMFLSDIFLALMHIPLGGIVVIGLIYGARAIFEMFRGMVGLFTRPGIHVNLFPTDFSFWGCLFRLLLIALLIYVVLQVIKIVSIAIVLIGIVVGCVYSVIDLMRAESEDNNTYNNNI